MIKNKILDVKNIFKTWFKSIKNNLNFQTYFCFIEIK